MNIDNAEMKKVSDSFARQKLTPRRLLSGLKIIQVLLV